MQEVVITGAKGFIGRHVSRRYAAQGYTVTGLGHGCWQRSEWQQWGLSAWHDTAIDRAALNSYAGTPAIIIHCAGGASVGDSIDHPHDDFARTVRPTRDLLDYIRDASPRTRLIYLSSAAVYGQATSFPIQETAPLVPLSPYGQHKQIAEDLCRSYSVRFGLDVAIVRFFSVYGPGLRRQLLWDACQTITAGERLFAGTGGETRDWLHVEDAAALLLCLGERDADAPTLLNGASGQGVTVKQILQAIIAELGVAATPVFTGAARPGDPLSYIGDPTRAQALGWAAATDWRDGVREYVNWYRETLR